MTLCKCGCGGEVSQGKIFLQGHYSTWKKSQKNKKEGIPIIQDQFAEIQIPQELNNVIEQEAIPVIELPTHKPQEPLTVFEIVKIIEEVKGKLKTWKVEPGYFTMQEGINLLPIGTTSTDMKRVETITKINTANDLAKHDSDYMKYVYVIGGMAVIMVVAYMVISAYKGSG